MATQKIETALIADDAVTSAKLDTNIDIAGTLDVTGATTLDAGLTVDTTTLVVDATNNRVGIGTASPSTALEVNNASAGATVATFEGSYSASGDVKLASFERNGGAVAAAIEYNDATTDMELGTTTSHSFSLKTGDTRRLTIDSSGNIGIGTTSPLEKLDVRDYTGIAINSNYCHVGSTVSGAMAIFGHNIKSDSGTNIIKSANTGYHSSMIKMYYNEGITFHATSGTATAGDTFYDISGTTNELMRITNSGNVGIGETTPLGKLHVKEGDSGQGSVNSNFDQLVLEDDAHSGMTILSGASSDGGIYFGDSGGNNLGQFKYKHSSNSFTFTTNNGSESLIIDSSGNVGIGEPNPDASLHITSNTPIISFDESDAGQEYRIGSFGGAFALYDSTDAAYRLVVDGSGNVGIGTSSPLGKLHIQDSAQSLSHTYIYDDSSLSIEATEASIQLMAQDSGTHGASVLWRYGDNVFAAISNPTTDALDIIYGVSTANDFQVHSGTNMSSYKKTVSFLSSGGITFNGDTAAADTLDDYEEGTWSPTLANAYNITSLTLTEAGRFTKIGNLVHLEFQVTGSFTNAAVESRFSFTLPFNTATTSSRATGMFAHHLTTFSNGRFNNGQVFQGTATDTALWVYVSTNQLSGIGSFNGRGTVTYVSA